MRRPSKSRQRRAARQRSCYLSAEPAALVTTSGKSAWFIGVLVLTVYVIFAMTLYLLPPVVQ